MAALNAATCGALWRLYSCKHNPHAGDLYPGVRLHVSAKIHSAAPAPRFTMASVAEHGSAVASQASNVTKEGGSHSVVSAQEAAWQRALEASRAVFPPEPPVQSRRLIPLMDFNSNLPLNNKQETFGLLMDRAETEGTDKQAVFTYLGFHRITCRIAMQNGGSDMRLHDPPPCVRMSFAKPKFSSKLDAPPCTLSSSGDTAPVTPLIPVATIQRIIAAAAAERARLGIA